MTEDLVPHSNCESDWPTVQPCIDAAQCKSNVLESGDKSILGGIRCGGRVAHNAIGEIVDLLLVGQHQLVESVYFALLSSSNQALFVHCGEHDTT